MKTIHRIYSQKPAWTLALLPFLFATLIGATVPNTTVDPSFRPVVGTGGQFVYHLTKRSDGKFVASGQFSIIGGARNYKVGLLNVDGSADESFTTGSGPTNDSIPTLDTSVLLNGSQSDNKIIIYGNFDHVDGLPRKKLTRLNPNGTVDPSFDVGEGVDGNVNMMQILPNDKVLLGGDFSTFNSEPVPNLIRLNADGTLDITFQSGFASSFSTEAIAVQPNGRIIVAGYSNVLRLNEDGSPDPTFSQATSLGGKIESLSLQSDNKILVGGSFTSFNGVSHLGIAKLNSNGTVDDNFNPSIDTNFKAVYAFAEQANGQIVIAGNFRFVNGVIRNCLARLNADGTIDESFNALIENPSNSTIYSAHILPDQTILIGGSFYTVGGGQTRSGIGLINNDGSISSNFVQGATNVGNIVDIAVRRRQGGYFGISAFDGDLVPDKQQ